MTKSVHLAIDIGASGGIHLVGEFQGYSVDYIEVYRFDNHMEKTKNGLIWDVERLYQEILNGIIIALHRFPDLETVGIDTWGVDYVLLCDHEIIMPVYAYRNDRTKASIDKVHSIIDPSKLYWKTGTQFQPFNTIYQLFWDKLQDRLAQATDVLMLPEYFFYRLTGKKIHEYTNATTTGLYNSTLDQYDKEIIRKLGLPRHLFSNPVKPGYVAPISDKLKSMLKHDLNVVLVATHDTASAVEAVDIDFQSIYISSGTWSLIGIKTKTPIISEIAQEKNFTNEGGNGYIRFQKNIMGLWIIQELKRELNISSFKQMIDMATTSEFDRTFDVNDNRFLSPKSMLREIRNILMELYDSAPISVEAIIKSVFQSLALSYHQTISEIEEITSKTYDTIVVFGGGAKNQYLNDLISKYSNKTVVSYPIEASAIGNIIVQKEVS